MIVQRPAEVFRLIYDFLGEEPYPHDFSAVEYDAPSFDAGLGLDGLHRVHPQVAPRPRDTILPPDLFQKYNSLAYWRDLPNSAAFRIVSVPPPGDRSSAPQDTMPGATAPVGGA